MKVIVYTGDNGNANVLTPVYPETPLTAEEEAKLLKRIQQKDVPPLPDGSPRPSFIKEKESTEITRMGMLFESWRLSPTGALVWNAEAGRDLKLREIRAVRKPILEKLDVQFIRALEDGDTSTVAEVSAKKKRIRDVTLIDLTAYDTPEKLNAFMPETLTYL